MRKSLVGSFLCLFLLTLLAAIPEAQLKELLNPESIHVSKEMIFITQGAEILCYQKKDLKFVRKFGARGQGPGEFDISPIDNLGLRLFFTGDEIVVNSAGKISFFTRRGILIREKRIQFAMQYFMMAGDKYVASEIEVRVEKQRHRVITVNLYDANFKKVAKLQEVPHWVQIPQSVDPIALVLALKNQNHRGLLFQVSGKVIYVETGDRNGIDLFDFKGKKISTITHSFEKVKLGEKFKGRIISYLKKRLPNYYQGIRDVIKFPSYYPAIRSFHISNRMLYVRVHQSSPDIGLFYVFSTAGKFIKRKSVSLREVGVLCTYPFVINDKKIYQLVEDDEENWRLTVTDL